MNKTTRRQTPKTQTLWVYLLSQSIFTLYEAAFDVFWANLAGQVVSKLAVVILLIAYLIQSSPVFNLFGSLAQSSLCKSGTL